MSRTVVAQLRDLAPLRPLTRSEALSIAERQAYRFLELLGVSEGPVPEDLIANLPRIEVMRTSPFPASGATQWTRGRWLIVLNSSEAYVRQRFSLAHELKHIIDHPFVGQLYGGVDAGERAAWAEQVCDYFAGCLLMPRPWLKRAWTTETQDIAVLARRFHVSQAAMSTRLHQTGIMPPKPRCTPGDDWLRRAVAEVARTARYQRQAPSPILIGGLVT